MLNNGATIDDIISFAKNDGSFDMGIGSPGGSGDDSPDDAYDSPSPDDGPPQQKIDNTNSQQSYKPPPKDGLPGFPDAGKGGRNNESGRWRWKDKNGDILEWDKQHGEVEKYDKTGKTHKGSYDPNTGDQIKPPVKGRTTPKYEPPTLDPTLGIRIYLLGQEILDVIKRDWNAPPQPCNCD